MIMKYDIFISYRREAFEQANLFATRLKAAGYRVFFDIEAMNAGMFNEQLIDVISKCKDFILILSPGALDRCNNENDWVRREVECAIAWKKNIVPVMLSGFEWPEMMPQGLEQLCLYQAIAPIPNVYYDMQVKKLTGYLKSKPYMKRRKVWLIVLGIIAALILGLWLVSTIMFKPLAQQAGETLSMQVDCIEQMMRIAHGIDKEWNSSLRSLDLVGNDEDKESIKQELVRYLDSQEQQLLQLEKQRQAFQIPGAKTFLMSFHISPVDFMIFEESNKMFAEQISGFYMGLLRQTIDEEDFSALKRKLLAGELKSDSIFADGIYYSYAQLMSHLPEEAQNPFYEMSPKWLYLPKTSLNLPDKEYERLQSIGLEQIRRMTNAMNLYLQINEPILDEMEQQLHDLEAQNHQLDSLLDRVLEE